MRYKGDPRWIKARFNSKCSRCGDIIQRGEEAFYYPNGNGIYCDRGDCGRDASREFAAAVADEDFYNR